jgi:hypothetical protein
MKKILFFILLGLSVQTYAHGPHGHWRHGGDNRWFWVAPVIIGSAIAYEVTRPPQTVIIQQPVPQPQVIQGQNCSPWTQIQNPDGTITTTRTCY